MIDTNAIKFRASAIGIIMTNDRSGKAMGETAKTYAEQRLKEIRYQRKKEYGNKYIDKGLACEEDAITLLSLEKKRMFRKNENQLEGDCLTGTPDLYIGPTINEASEIFDTKCSWDLWTFPNKTDKLNPIYYWQMMAYMALTGATRATVSFCLVNATPSIIDSEKKRLYFAMDCPNEDDIIYVSKCCDIEKNMIFDMQLFKKQHQHYDLHLKHWDYDIPRKERLVEFEILRDDAEISRIYQRVEECRFFIKTLIA